MSKKNAPAPEPEKNTHDDADQAPGTESSATDGAEQTPPEVTPPKAEILTYTVIDGLAHNGKDYKPGDKVLRSVFTEEQAERLIGNRVIE